MPQAPQFVVSLLLLTHVAPHSAKPEVGQAQVPLRQVVPAGHTVPQAPQLPLSVQVSTQATPQNCLDDAPSHTHSTPLQCWPEGQVLPQPPQLALSFFGTHTPPQCRSLAHWQVIDAHVSPERQAFAQSPQLAASVPVSTQLWPHALRDAFTHLQEPNWQPCSGPQAFPHAPQLAASVLLSTRLPPHSTCPAGQAHFPPAQVPPVAQAIPQPPHARTSLAVDTQPEPGQYVSPEPAQPHAPSLHT